MVRHLYRPIWDYGKSYALLADCEVEKTAVVFVHGFCGHPRKTWLLFQSLVDELHEEFPAWGIADLFFYGYDAFGPGINLNAEAFVKFLNRIFPVPQRGLFNLKIERLPAALRPAFENVLLPIPKRYKKLVLVGHSMGAVIIRAAILQYANNKLARLNERGRSQKELNNLRMLHADVRLFSPAHFGANPAGWMGVILNLPFIGEFLRAWLQYGQAYGDLSDSNLVLRDLKDQTTLLAETFPSLKALRAKSMWGTGEKIVAVGNYKYDLESEQVSGVSHFEVCKPTSEYKLPLRFVMDYGTAETAVSQSSGTL
jgi:hypothetical protein